MIDFTKPVQTRDGRKVRILCTDRKSSPHHDGHPLTVVGLVTQPNGTEIATVFTSQGKFYSGGGDTDDLINIPEKVYVLTAYKAGDASSAYSNTFFESEAAASAGHMLAAKGYKHKITEIEV